MQVTDDQYSSNVMAAKEQIDYRKLWTAPYPAASYPLAFLFLPCFDIPESAGNSTL
jgi:hypothetical protein